MNESDKLREALELLRDAEPALGMGRHGCDEWWRRYRRLTGQPIKTRIRDWSGGAVPGPDCSPDIRFPRRPRRVQE